MNLSVIIPTFNPHFDRLKRVLVALSNQTLPINEWELIIIDNASKNNTLSELKEAFLPNTKIVKELKQGLTYARLKGFEEARGEYIIMVDDDNILNERYLEWVIYYFEEYEQLGAFGGKSIPDFEVTPPTWINQFEGNLALRDLGDEIKVSDPFISEVNEYPSIAPIGAGMSIRKTALDRYINLVGHKNITDRKGKTLTSGGDNDIVIEILKAGWGIGYFPNLLLTHIIPKGRLQVNYLSRLSRDTMISWINLLHIHNICPWTAIPQWSVLPRKIKSYFMYQAWKGGANYIKWKGSCGMYEGLAEIYQK